MLKSTAADQTGSALVDDPDAAGVSKLLGKKDKPADVVKKKNDKYKNLKQQVTDLKLQVKIAKEQYSTYTKSEIAVNSSVKVSHKVKLDPEEACYKIAIECETPIDLICLRGDLAVDLLEDNIPAGVILSRTDGDSTNPLLATYRFQEALNRLVIKLRTTESTGTAGRTAHEDSSASVHGSLSVFVVPEASPKVARLLSIPIKPLSLHSRVTDPPHRDCPLHEMNLKGSFSSAEVQRWLSICLNDVPQRVSEDDFSLMVQISIIFSPLLHFIFLPL